MWKQDVVGLADYSNISVRVEARGLCLSLAFGALH